MTGAVTKHTAYVKTDLLDEVALRELVESCGDGPLVIFFALPPQVTMKVCDLLQHVDLPEVTRLALEKPFGTDHASAVAFNALLHKVVTEEDIFRIDHFLGVATVFNLVGLRFANRMLAPIWSAEHIERVEIVYDEDLALEGRAGYYDGAGALKDMLQSHLLQVLALFAMESIATLDARELQDQKAQVLRATKVWGGSPKRSSRRARYTAGHDRAAGRSRTTRRRRVSTPARPPRRSRRSPWRSPTAAGPGCRSSCAAARRMGAPRKQIVAHFRDVPHLPTGFVGGSDGDQLTIDLKPGAVSLTLTMNAEGDPLDLEQKTLTATLAAPRMQPYGEVLAQIFDGSQLLTVRGDAAEECWRVMAPVIKAWADDRVPLETYAAGSTVPTAGSRPSGRVPSARQGRDRTHDRVRRGCGPSRARGRRSGRARGAGSRRRTSRRCPSCGRWCG